MVLCSVANHTVILRCLDPDNILELICLLLLEYKVVLHSTRPALLTSFGESICSVSDLPVDSVTYF